MKTKESIFKSLYVLSVFGLLFSCEQSPDDTTPAVQGQIYEAENIQEKIFLVVEDMPFPVGGMDVFSEYLSKNINYPSEAKEAGIEGRVFIQFVVDKTGKLTDVKSVKGIGGGCDEEAIRVVRESANWNPGQQRGRKVNVRLILPVTFKLD